MLSSEHCKRYYLGVNVHMKLSSLILGCMMTMLTTLPAVSSEKPLIEVTDVDRDTVPAGTPAAFEVAFPLASQNEAVRKIERTIFISYLLHSSRSPRREPHL